MLSGGRQGVALMFSNTIRRGLLAAMLPLMLVACEEERSAAGSTVTAGAGGANFAPAAARAMEMTAGKRVAVTHNYTLRLPRDEVQAIQKRHIDECVKLGCTILSTRLDRYDTRLTASSSLRIAPDRYEAFLAVLTAPPADVTNHAEHAEDKAVAYMDVEKRLESKLALRDKLTAMLRDPAIKTPADLVAIEKELSQAQGEIESATAQRDYLRTITETIKVDVFYNGVVAQAAGFDLTPVHTAVKNFMRTMVASLAAMISFVASLIAWLPVIAVLVWVVRYGIRRWRTRRGKA